MNLNKVLHICSYVLIGAIILFGLISIWVIFFGGIRVQIGDLRIRSTTIEFPLIALFISIALFFLVKGSWKDGLLFLGALVFCVFVGEVFLRLTDNPLSKPYIDFERWYEPSNLLGHQLVPNFEGFGPLNIPVKINSQGFRNNHDYETAKAPDTIRILALGDSFTFGWGVPLEETFLKQLEGRLRERTGKIVETINSGVPGWGLNHFYVYLKHFGLVFNPDIIVLGFYNDDIPDSLQEAIPPRVQFEGGLKYKAGIWHQIRIFNFAQYVGHWVRHRNRHKRLDYLFDLSSRRNQLMGRESYLLMAKEGDTHNKYHDILKESLGRINELAIKAGATLILMNIPDIALLNHPELQHINAVLKENADALDIPLVDMTPIFEKERDPSTYYLHPLDPHTNAAGHLQMAKALTPLACQALSQKEITCRDR